MKVLQFGFGLNARKFEGFGLVSGSDSPKKTESKRFRFGTGLQSWFLSKCLLRSRAIWTCVGWTTHL